MSSRVVPKRKDLKTQIKFAEDRYNKCYTELRELQGNTAGLKGRAEKAERCLSDAREEIAVLKEEVKQLTGALEVLAKKAKRFM